MNREIYKIKAKIDILLVEQEEQINGHLDNLIIAYIKEAYNLGLQDAVDNIKHGVWYPDAPYSGNTGSEYYVDDKDIGEPESYIDKESILKLKL